MPRPIIFANNQFFDGNGDPLVGGKLYSYVAESSTPKVTYADPEGNSPNTNPVILDADGRATVYGGSGLYKFVLTDANDVEIWTADNVDANPTDAADGVDGKSILNGTGAPDDGFGNDSDFYLDTAAMTIYGPKASGVWPTPGVSLIGPAGNDGADGSDGADGKTVLNGTVDPTTEGVDGDFYINTATWQIFGPKSGTWGTGTDILGADGSNGNDGADGQGVPTGGTANQILQKIDGTDFNTQWVDIPVSLPDQSGKAGKYLQTNGTAATWEDVTAGVSSVNGQTGAVTLNTSHVSEGGNLYFTDSRAKTAAVLNTLAGSETDQAPSVSATKTALAAKQDSLGFTPVPNTRTVNGKQLNANVTIAPGDVAYTPTTSADWLSVPSQVQQALDNIAAQKPMINLMTDWTAYTPTIVGYSTACTNVNFFYRRVGSSLQVRGNYTTGTISGTTLSISLPTGLTADTTKISSTKNSVIGKMVRSTSGASASPLVILLAPGSSTSTVGVSVEAGSAATYTSPAAANTVHASSEDETLYFELPISQWAQSTTVDIFQAGDYGPTAYTPTFTGLGTVTNIEAIHWRVGSHLYVDCKFTAGSSTATEARVSLPGSLTSAGTSIIPSIKRAGEWAYNTSGGLSGQILVEPSVGYFTFGLQGGSDAGLTKQNGSSIFGSGRVVSFTAKVAISGWSTFPIGVAMANYPSNSIHVQQTNGQGSSSTAVLRWANVLTNSLSDMTYADSSTLGGTFTVNPGGAGWYDISASASLNGSSTMGISVNASQLTTDPPSMTTGQLLATCQAAADTVRTCHAKVFLSDGAVVRIHANTGIGSGSTNVLSMVRIVKTSD